MASWRVARSLEQLRSEINATFPDRDKASDGAKGDAAHASRKSDHNPDQNGVVRARDFDEDLLGADNPLGQEHMVIIAEHVRRMGDYGDPRLNGHRTGVNGYVIYEGHIAGAGKGWKWRTYTGPNRHDHHLHVSVCGDPQGYDDASTWHIADLFKPRPTPAPTPEEDDDMDYIVEVTDDNSPVYYWVSPMQVTTIGNETELGELSDDFKIKRVTQFEFDMIRRARTYSPR